MAEDMERTVGKRELGIPGKEEMSRALEGTPFARDRNPRAYEMLTEAMGRIRETTLARCAEYGKDKTFRDKFGIVLDSAGIIEANLAGAETAFNGIAGIAKELGPEIVALAPKEMEDVLEAMVRKAEFSPLELRDLHKYILKEGQRGKKISEYSLRAIEVETVIGNRTLYDEKIAERLLEMVNEANEILYKYRGGPMNGYYRMLHEVRLNLVPVENVLVTAGGTKRDAVSLAFRAGFSEVVMEIIKTDEKGIYAEFERCPDLLMKAWEGYDEALKIKDRPGFEKLRAELKGKRDALTPA